MADGRRQALRVRDTGWPGESPIAPTAARLRAETGWTVHTWDTRHNVMWDGPARLLELLLAV